MIVTCLGVLTALFGIYLLTQVSSFSLNKFSSEGRDTLAALAVLALGLLATVLGWQALPRRQKR
ncbi:MAG: hypothetical protein CL625_08125 [Arenimonas sp.]|nr:hypothetical protein [Arenimonas sp.]